MAVGVGSVAALAQSELFFKPKPLFQPLHYFSVMTTVVWLKTNVDLLCAPMEARSQEEGTFFIVSIIDNGVSFEMFQVVV